METLQEHQLESTAPNVRTRSASQLCASVTAAASAATTLAAAAAEASAVVATAAAAELDVEKQSRQRSKSHTGGPYYCYIIASKNRTYNGYTNNLQRRIRQHNGEIRGGAKATHNRGPWQYIAIMTCTDWNAVRAMQCEYTIKYPTRHKPRPSQFQGPVGRIRSLKEVCKNVPTKDEEYTIYIHDEYAELLKELDLGPRVTIAPLNNLIIPT